MNKRGQIHIGLIAVVALALSIAALVVYVSFSSNLQTNSEDFSTLSTNIIFADQYIHAQTQLSMKNAIQNCPACSTTELQIKFRDEINKHDYRINSVGNFFGKIRNDEFQLTQIPSGYEFKIENLFLQSDVSANKLRRDFTLCMNFDNTGNFVSNC